MCNDDDRTGIAHESVYDAALRWSACRTRIRCAWKRYSGLYIQDRRGRQREINNRLTFWRTAPEPEQPSLIRACSSRRSPKGGRTKSIARPQGDL